MDFDSFSLSLSCGGFFFLISNGCSSLSILNERKCFRAINVAHSSVSYISRDDFFPFFFRKNL